MVVRYGRDRIELRGLSRECVKCTRTAAGQAIAVMSAVSPRFGEMYVLAVSRVNLFAAQGPSQVLAFDARSRIPVYSLYALGAMALAAGTLGTFLDLGSVGIQSPLASQISDAVLVHRRGMHKGT